MLLKCLGLAAVISFTQQTAAAPHVNQPQATDLENQKLILHYVNEYRAQHRLAPLKLSHQISQEARLHSKEMATKKIPFGHIGYSQRIHHLYQQYDNCNGGAENVAYYRINAKKLVEGWIASRGHRRNIEGNYNLTGIGIAYSGKPGWAYFTQIFLRSDGKKIG